MVNFTPCLFIQSTNLYFNRQSFICPNYIEVKQAVVDKIKQADNYREMKKMADLLKNILLYK